MPPGEVDHTQKKVAPGAAQAQDWQGNFYPHFTVRTPGAQDIYLGPEKTCFTSKGA